MNRPDNHQHNASETVAGTIEGWVFRLLRGLVGARRPTRRQNGSSGDTAGTGNSIVACLGASATEAIGSYDWIHDLEQRPSLASLRFYRFAQGGDLAYNGLQRLPEIISCHPDYVIILLGENDVLAVLSKKVAQFDRLTKHLPSTPSPEWYRENMQALVHRLKRETPARIALCSLIPLGEDPHSADPFQAEANRLIEEYSDILQDLAREEGVSYLPLYERLHELILASPGRALTSFDFLPFYRDVFRQFVLHQSHDQIGQRNGWRLHRDGIHLNSRSGILLADLVQEFLGRAPGMDSPQKASAKPGLTEALSQEEP